MDEDLSEVFLPLFEFAWLDDETVAMGGEECGIAAASACVAEGMSPWWNPEGTAQRGRCPASASAVHSSGLDRPIG